MQVALAMTRCLPHYHARPLDRREALPKVCNFRSVISPQYLARSQGTASRRRSEAGGPQRTCDRNKLSASINEAKDAFGMGKPDPTIFNFDMDWPSEVDMSNLARQTSSEHFDDVRIFWHVTSEIRAAANVLRVNRWLQ